MAGDSKSRMKWAVWGLTIAAVIITAANITALTGGNDLHFFALNFIGIIGPLCLMFLLVASSGMYAEFHGLKAHWPMLFGLTIGGICTGANLTIAILVMSGLLPA